MSGWLGCLYLVDGASIWVGLRVFAYNMQRMTVVNR